MDTIQCQGWITMTLPSPLILNASQPWIAAIEYHSGAQQQTPSLVTDASYDIPSQSVFYRRDQVWQNHDGPWEQDDPANLGYTMIRTLVDPEGPDALYLEQIAEAVADTTLSSGQPTKTYGSERYLLAGDYAGSTYGTLRSLIQFGPLTRPDPRAVLRQATLRVSNYSAISMTASSTIYVHDATSAWVEESATWQSDGLIYGELIDSTMIAARSRPAQLYGNGYLCFDLLNQAQSWLDSPESNHGVMLLGDETAQASGQYFRSREYPVYPAFRPQLALLWEWPAPMPTVDPSQSHKLSLPLVLK